MRRIASSLLLAGATLALLSGCGGGDGEQGSSAARDQSAAAAKSKGDAAEQEKAQGQEESGAVEASPNPARQDVPVGSPTPGSKAVAPGVPVVKGGDNSIQTFGTEAEEAPRDQAVSNLLAYRDARLAGRFARACALASAEFRDQLVQLIASAKVKGGAEKPEGCADILALFTPERDKAALRERFQLSEVLSFRARGDGYAYLIFKGAGGKPMFIAMADDEGRWKVNVPEPEAFMLGSGTAQ